MSSIIPNRTIAKQYSEYVKLLVSKKVAKDSMIILERKDIKRAVCSKTTFLTISPVEKPLSLFIEMAVQNNDHFKFKMFCSSFVDAPIFRFDSDGPVHKQINAGLGKSKVNTPHFHKFESSGIEIAYQTSKLKQKSTSNSFKDIENCFDHFCDEAKIRAKNNSAPELVPIIAGSLDIKTVQSDPLKNISFPI